MMALILNVNFDNSICLVLPSVGFLCGICVLFFCLRRRDHRLIYSFSFLVIWRILAEKDFLNDIRHNIKKIKCHLNIFFGWYFGRFSLQMYLTACIPLFIILLINWNSFIYLMSFSNYSINLFNYASPSNSSY